MIVVDTSALMAVLKRETAVDACEAILSDGSQRLLMSAATVTEAHIVAARNQRLAEMKMLMTASITEIIPLTAACAERAATAYQRFGKGFHSAAFNFGDCFSYPRPRSLTARYSSSETTSRAQIYARHWPMPDPHESL